MENNNVNSWRLKSPFKVEPTLEEIRKFLDENNGLANSATPLKVPDYFLTIPAGSQFPEVHAPPSLDLAPIVPPTQSIELTSHQANASQIPSTGNSYTGIIALAIVLMIVGLISYLVYRRSKAKFNEDPTKTKSEMDQSSRYFASGISDKFENSEFGKIAKHLAIGLGYMVVAIMIFHALTALLKKTKSFVNEVKN